MTLVVRTLGDPMRMATAASGVIRSLDSNQPVAEVRSMEQVLGRTMARQRFAAVLLTVFSILALLLAAVGVYSVLSYIVAERFQEVGVRIALGAQAKDVMRMIVSQGLRWLLAGLATGLCAALVLSRFLRSLLFGVQTADLVTLVGVACLLLVVGLIATFLPAWRASHLDPVRLLRQQ